MQKAKRRGSIPNSCCTPRWKTSGTRDNLLFNLGDEQARGWLYEVLSGFIRENGIDILRIDYNINPLPYWRDQ